MLVLVTGASGDVGGPVLRDLLDHGHGVRALVLAPDVGLPPEVETLVGDCRDAAAVASAVDGVDGVVHLAAMRDPVGAPRQVFAHNTRATFTVLAAAGAAGVHGAVTASSTSVLGLGWGPDHLRPAYVPVDEDHLVLPHDPYALSKQADEATASMVHRRWGTAVTALRLPFCQGTEEVRRRATVLAENPAQGAKELWAWLHVDDAATAFRLALERPGEGARVMHVVAPTVLAPQQTHWLLDRFRPDVPRRWPLPGRDALFRSDRVREMLAWAPAHPDAGAL